MRSVLFLGLLAGGLLVGCGETFLATGGAGGTGASGGTGVGSTTTSAASVGGGGSGGTTTQGGSGPGGSGTGGCVDADGDSDGDGLDGCNGDCDDANGTVYPGAPELCDGLDNACAGGGPDDPVGCGGFYVSEAGDDSADGSKEAPFATIGHGIEVAREIATAAGAVTVYVAKGSYNEGVQLAPNVSLRGDCVEPEWTCADQMESVIYGQDEGAVVAGEDITGTTVVEGFTIVAISGPDVGSSVGIDILGGGPKIKGNAIQAGTVTNDFEASVGVRIDADAPTENAPKLIGNAIYADDAQFASIGVWMRSGHISAVLDRNTIVARSALFSNGVAIGDAGQFTVVHNNKVQAGEGTVGQFVQDEPGNSWGMVILQGKVNVDGNEVNVNNQPDLANVGTYAACVAPVLCGGILTTSDQVTIWNNVVYGADADGSAGIAVLESSKVNAQSAAVVVNSNYVNPTGKPLLGEPPSPDSVSGCFVIFTDYTGSNRQVGRFRNNICTGGSNERRYGLLEVGIEGVPTDPEPGAFTHNDVFLPLITGTTAFSYHDVNSGGMADLLPSNVNGIPNASNNLTQAPQFVGGKLGLLSPCIDMGTDEEAPDHDRDSEARPKGAGFDIGPDEVK